MAINKFFKRLCKSFKSIFKTRDKVSKEVKVIIHGSPSDVRHVAHFGPGNPHWMKNLKTAPDFTTSIGCCDNKSPLPPQELFFEDLNRLLRMEEKESLNLPEDRSGGRKEAAKPPGPRNKSNRT